MILNRLPFETLISNSPINSVAMTERVGDGDDLTIFKKQDTTYKRI